MPNLATPLASPSRFPPAVLGNGKPITIDEILRRSDKLVPMPQVVTQAMAQLRGGDSLGKIGRTLSTDTAASAALLRLANSALFRGRVEIRDVPSAVTRIGAKNLQQLLISLTVLKPDKRETEIARTLRSLMIANAAASRVVARYIVDLPSETAFIIGLLSDVGQLLLALAAPSSYGVVSADAAMMGTPVEALELEWLGFSHDVLGAGLLENWKMPGPVVEGVRYHHQLPRALEFGDDTLTLNAAIAALGGHAAAAVCGLLPEESIGAEGLKNEAAQSILQLSDEVLNGLYEECKQAAFEFGSILRM